MDYLYGRLNKLVQKVEYTGNSSSTIDIDVNNINRSVGATLRYTPINTLETPAEDGTYVLKATVINGEPHIEWELV